VYFYFAYQPVEMRTAATERFQHALSTYAHVTGEPTLLDYVGYLSATALVTGLNASGPNPTPAELISTLSQTRTVDDAGLLGAHPISFVPGQRIQSNVCVYVTRYVGTNFQPVTGADPICGSVIPGRTVSP
jgi:branched-chain amino acid transport system substrate-binding protein